MPPYQKKKKKKRRKERNLQADRDLNNKTAHSLSTELAETSDYPLITLYSCS
jgi:hypothetical protein